MAKTNTLFTHLNCEYNQEKYSPTEIQTYCKADPEPLVAKYDLSKGLSKDILDGRPHDMWRYREVLPVFDDQYIFNLGEGWTPIIDMVNHDELFPDIKLTIKDEGQNPTGSFKSRGLSMAVAKAKELGIQEIAIPTAGNAGSALSAYCARANMQAHIFMPKVTPEVFQKDCKVMGANVTIVDGNIADCAKLLKSKNQDGDWFDVSTLKEPYRLEGKKTMGYEIAEQLNWKIPDAIVYPTGGGTGLIGIWKAFKEMQELGWIDVIPTKMIAVQTTGCDPIVQAFNNKQDYSTPYTNPAETIANGLRVPHAFGHRLILDCLYGSKGSAIAVSEADMLDSIHKVAQKEGLFLSPEGAACHHATQVLYEQSFFTPGDHVMILNTGSMYKYIENID